MSFFRRNTEPSPKTIASAEKKPEIVHTPETLLKGVGHIYEQFTPEQQQDFLSRLQEFIREREKIKEPEPLTSICLTIDGDSHYAPVREVFSGSGIVEPFKQLMRYLLKYRANANCFSVLDDIVWYNGAGLPVTRDREIDAITEADLYASQPPHGKDRLTSLFSSYQKGIAYTGSKIKPTQGFGVQHFEYKLDMEVLPPIPETGTMQKPFRFELCYRQNDGSIIPFNNIVGDNLNQLRQKVAVAMSDGDIERSFNTEEKFQEIARLAPMQILQFKQLHGKFIRRVS